MTFIKHSVNKYTLRKKLLIRPQSFIILSEPDIHTGENRLTLVGASFLWKEGNYPTLTLAINFYLAWEGMRREGRRGRTEIIGREKEILRSTRKCHIPEITIYVESCLVIEVDHISFSTADHHSFKIFCNAATLLT